MWVDCIKVSIYTSVSRLLLINCTGHGTHLVLDIGKLAHACQIALSALDNLVGEAQRIFHPGVRQARHVWRAVGLLFCLCLVDHLDLFLVRLSRQLTPLVFLGFTPVSNALSIFHCNWVQMWSHRLMITESFAFFSLLATLRG